MSEYLYKGVSSVTGDWLTGSLYVVELDRMFIMDPKGCAQVRPETVCPVHRPSGPQWPEDLQE